MLQSNTPTLKKQHARRLVTEISQPEGMSRVTWAGVQTVLKAIAEFYPKAWPSQITLSERTGIPNRTLKRYIAAAVKAGVLVVLPDAGAKRKRACGTRTNVYLLKLASMNGAKMAYEYKNYYVVLSEKRELKTSSSVLLAGPAAPRTTPENQAEVISMAEARKRLRPGEERERQLDPDYGKEAPRRGSKTRSRNVTDEDMPPKEYIRSHKSKRALSQERLANYFETNWQLMVLNTQLYKGVAGVTSYGQVYSYLNKHFANRTELEVRHLMEDFLRAVGSGHISLKPGQTGWLCFTGSWGRLNDRGTAGIPNDDDMHAGSRKRLAEGKSG